ncbi:MAG: SusC/RagA family TonB-linked outer membrane protein [Bacteroidaceae bacterium]|nr:SusC/RagA family TonB-linked outer membrane protein [Bacteroidaceae bacterium]
MKRILLLLCCVLSATLLSAQDTGTPRRVRGTVTSEDGEPLVGVAVRVRGTQNGAQTDLDGHFVLDCRPGNILDISYIGFKPNVAKVGKREILVTMEEDAKTMEQVVVNGYTQTDIRKATGSVGILTEKDLKDQPLANVDMLMQGKLAGVNVQAVSGRPGESAKVRIRGTSSITGNNEPLWVVDGVPIQKNIPTMGSSYVRSGDFSTLYANGVAGIPPQNIESITVLKDAAAAAIYGSEAQAGVIVITTKKGQAGKLHLSYSGNVTMQTAPSRDHNLMNTEEKLAYEQSIWDEFSADGFANGGWYPKVGIIGQIRSGFGQFAGMTTAEQDAYIEELKKTNTDWFQELFRNTVSTSHSVSASGGSDKLTYYVSGGLSTNKGIVKKSSSDGYNFSAKINAHPSEKVSMSFDASYNYLKAEAASLTFDMFNYAYFANPYEKPYNDDGSYRADDTFFNLATLYGNIWTVLPDNGVNVMREIDETSAHNISSSTTLRGDITWRINDHFRLYGLASYTYSNDISENEIGQNTYAAWNDRPFEYDDRYSKRIYGSLTQNNNFNRSWLVRAQANYNQTFKDIHHVSAVFGTEVRNNYAQTMHAKYYGYDPVTGNHSTPLYYHPSADYAADMQRYQNITSGLTGQSRTEDAFASFYGALDYVLLNRYVVNATARSDGSNNFGAKEQFNLTWSAGLAWNIDEERFMKKIKHIISHATIRLSTGLTGGVNKSVYPVLIMNYATTFRNSETQAYRMADIGSPPNPYLRWEHTHDWNGNLDIGFLKNRLNMNVSFYRRRGYDLVTNVRVVSTTGFTRQSYNTSEQVNQGVELMLSATPVKTKDWTWSINGNVAYNQNVLTEYNSPSGSLGADLYVGYPLGKIFTGKSTGINPETGIYNFQLRPDANPKTLADYRKTDNYLFYVGTTNYPWTGGLSTHISWKQFSLSISTSFFINGLVSNRVNPEADYSKTYLGNASNSIVYYHPSYDLYTAHLNKPKDAANRWTEDNPITNGYPRLVDAFTTDLLLDVDQPSYQAYNGLFYENGSYWKIGSITLMYNLPEKWLRHSGIESLGVNLTANNLWILTNYSGLNPETPGAVYPMSRSFSFGLNLGF